MSENLSELSGRQGLKDNLFDRLGKLAEPTGAPSSEELDQLANEFLVGKANTYGTSTFYDFLKPENKEKKVYVCNGTACVCAGTQEKLIDDLKCHFKENEIGHMTCLGRCHENSAFHYDGKNYSGSNHSVSDILKQPITGDDKYTVKASGHEILTTPFTSIDEYYAPYSAALQKSSAEVLEEIKTSFVRGRGGAGFPIGTKLEFCRNTQSETKFIICNADEGDPGA